MTLTERSAGLTVEVMVCVLSVGSASTSSDETDASSVICSDFVGETTIVHPYGHVARGRSSRIGTVSVPLEKTGVPALGSSDEAETKVTSSRAGRRSGRRSWRQLGPLLKTISV